jgi:acyl carrier protein
MSHDDEIAQEAERPRGNGAGTTLVQNQMERQFAETWQEILRAPSVGVNDNFFDLGGNSLAVIRFMSWISETYHVEIPLTSFFEHPTVGEMVTLVAGMQKAVGPGTKPGTQPR